MCQQLWRCIERNPPVSQCHSLSISEHPSTTPTEWSLSVDDPLGIISRSNCRFNGVQQCVILDSTYNIG